MSLRMHLDRPIVPLPPPLVFSRGKSVDVPSDLIPMYIGYENRNRVCDGDPYERGVGLASYWDFADGYGQSANYFARGLLNLGVPVKPIWLNWNLNSLDRSQFEDVKEAGFKSKFTGLPKISIAFTLPVDLFMAPSSPCLIGFSMWESDRLPCGWGELYNVVDCMIVPSEYCKQVWEASGYKGRLEICPLPINPMFRPSAAHSLLSSEGKFKFLFVSTPVFRKGIDSLVTAFQEAFSSEDCVEMHLHTRRWARNINPIEAQIRSLVEGDSRIVHTTERLSEEDLLGLYLGADCLVHPSRAEGFGLTPAAAMCMGMPTIGTSGTGMADFMLESAPGSIPVESWEDATDPFYRRFPQGQWAMPSQRKLIESMRDVVQHRRVFRNYAEEHGQILWKRHNPLAAATKLREIIDSTWEECKNGTSHSGR